MKLKSFKIAGVMLATLLSLLTSTGQTSAQHILTLEECLEKALSGNHGLEAFRHRVETYAAKVDETIAKMSPKFSVSGKYMLAGEQQRLWPARFDGEKGIYDDEFIEVAAVLVIPLWDGGRTRHRTEADRKLLESARASFARQEQRLLYDVKRLYFMALSRKERMRSLEASLESLLQHEKDVVSMVVSGKAARVDALRVEAEVALTRENLLKAIFELENLKEDLLMITGINDEIKDFDLAGSFPQVPGISKNSIGEKAAEALETRPDYIAALKKAEAGKQGVLAALALKNPEFFLRGLHGYRNASNGGSESRTDIELAVEIPILDGGFSSAKRRQAVSEASAAEAEALELASRVFFEVSEAIRACELAKERINIAEAAVRAAEEALRIERLKFRSGKGTTTDVLSTQAAWLKARAGYDAALADGAISGARLTFATGGEINEK